MDPRWQPLRDAVRARFRVIQEKERWLCVEVDGEQVTVGLAGEQGVEAVSPICSDRRLGAHQALERSRTMAFGALVLAQSRYCLRQVLPLSLLDVDATLRLVVWAAATTKALRAEILAHAETGEAPRELFAAYAA